MKIEKITKNWDIVEKYKCKSEKEFTLTASVQNAG